jgi:hypothetical protein
MEIVQMKNRARKVLVLALSLCATFYGMPRANAQSDGNDQNGSDTERKVTLTATGVQPKATGEAQVQFSSAGTALDQGLEIHSQNLAQNASYNIRVDGTVYATVKADANGQIGVVFQNQDTDSDGGSTGGTEDGDQGGSEDNGTDENTDEEANDVQLQLPAALTPVTKISLVEVVNSSGQVVLSGSFSSTGAQHMVATANITLAPAGSLQASGKTMISYEIKGKSRKQSVLIQATGLAPGDYSILINGLAAGTLKVGSSGAGQTSFNQKKKKNTLPPQVGSVLDITSVQIINSSSRVMLSGRLGS